MRRAIPALVALLTASAALAGDGADVAALGPSPSDADVAAAGTANPFGLPPLSALSATRERPLFSASRRPPPVAVAAPEAAAAPAAPVVQAPAEPQHPPFTLVGTLLGPGQGVAWLQDGSQTLQKMRQGENGAGWTLRKVGPRSVVFEKDGVSETLALPKAAQATAPISDPDADPTLLPPPAPVAAAPPGRARLRGMSK